MTEGPGFVTRTLTLSTRESLTSKDRPRTGENSETKNSLVSDPDTEVLDLKSFGRFRKREREVRIFPSFGPLPKPSF